jgi:SAM-dependent methyltransferase
MGHNEPDSPRHHLDGSPAFDRAAFWDAKILDWEASRYGFGASLNLVEGVAGQISSSVRFRRDAAIGLLTPHLAGRRIVEFGCGSGLLAEKLLALGAESYHGYDISGVAIAHAKQRATQSPRGEAMRFDVAALADIPLRDNAVTISLGLAEWLKPVELDRLFALSRRGLFLHGFSEKRRSVTQLIHRAYVHCSYGWKTDGYAPQYHRAAELAAIAKCHGIDRLNFYRHRRLRFGAFATNLMVD